MILLEGAYNLYRKLPKAICCCVQALLTTKNGNVQRKKMTFLFENPSGAQR